MFSLLLAVIYTAFISLGLPDSLLGSAWPSMYPELGVPLSFAGIISMIISVGTIVSSLFSDLLTKKLETGRVTTLSVALTAGALLGFSFSDRFWLLCLFAVPYGLGAGSIDAALNNYVALHYSNRHMSWLHCMWGVGTIIGPYIMSFALTSGGDWNAGYRYVSYLQFALTLALVATLPLWKIKKSEADTSADAPAEKPPQALSPIRAFRIKGAKEVVIAFFCYCALEQTTMLWASSYMVLQNGISEEVAASCASIFFIGITVGRFLNGFIANKLRDETMIRLGLGLLTVGALVLLLPFGQATSIAGISLIGLGCAPVYPCIIHATPLRFGEEKSQAMIGIQMASAYLGTCFMPPLFGIIANHISVALLPIYLLVFASLTFFSHEILLKKTKN